MSEDEPEVSAVVGAVIGETARRYRGSAVVGVVALLIVVLLPSRSPLPETFGLGPGALPPPAGPVASVPPLTSAPFVATTTTTTSLPITTSTVPPSTVPTVHDHHLEHDDVDLDHHARRPTTTTTTTTVLPTCELLGLACP